MEPNIWGPGAWTFLHSITLNYPDNPSIQDKKIYKDFFMMLPNILPCTICRHNLNKHYNELPINFALSNKETLSKWLVEIHNKSNAIDNKKIITYQEFLKIYEKKYENSNESITYFKDRLNNQKKLIYILIFFISISYTYFILIKKK
tara:strand:- start:1922 stop:2362 length:441 start_codon:yes stop_codon:yes gene_type:complete